ncbi:tripartite motif-containing protein 3-like [Lingula anatina]|uniref:Tripartite motif-containing protein 3-like n=1 Tax=Lingula anatina TaxID=7574 RepID=A0A2R2MMY2_LINAN|nr:tripartite motif-containing protein 3-like [Lingula anatina]|eukprot:XP_023931559.1 tripartite motif-containing protein 3-like [Lingula anatina]
MAEALAADIKEKILTCCICLGEERVQYPREGLVKLKKDFRVHTTKELLSQRQQHEVSSPSKETYAHGATQVIAQMAISCEKHPDNELKYYCEDDDTVVCSDCATIDHYRHGIVSVNKVAKLNRDKINAAFEKSLKTINWFKAAMTKACEDSYIRTTAIKSIQKQAQNMHKLITKRKKKMISFVNSSFDVQKKKKEANKDILDLQFASLQSACDFAQHLIANGTDSDIMVHAKSLIERLTAMEKTPVPTPDTPAQISYSPGKISTAGLEAMLGQVTVQSTPPLAGQGTRLRSTRQSSTLNAMLGQLTVQSPPPLAVLGKNPIKMAKCVHLQDFNAEREDDRGMVNILGLALDEEQVFVVDNGNGRTKMFTHAGEFKFDIKLNSPFDVAVSQTGRLYITSQDDKCYKVYSTGGQQVTTMGRGTTPGSKLESPRGITLNKQGHVMVCDGENKSIFTFHADSGQLLNTFPLSMCEYPVYITVNSVNDNIVISDCGKDCVHVLSPTGHQLFQYGTEGSGDGQLNGVRGVCTDSYGHILIADIYNHRIVALSPQGEFIRYIATENDALEYPVALAINPAGQLVVAEFYGQVKTVHYF